MDVLHTHPHRPLAPEILPSAEARANDKGSVKGAETARPVVEAAAATLPAPIKGLGILPLDTIEVGDGDPPKGERDGPTPPVTPEPQSATALTADAPAARSLDLRR